MRPYPFSRCITKNPTSPSAKRTKKPRHQTGDEASGADDQVRTGDLNLGKVALYQLSYICDLLEAAANIMTSAEPGQAFGRKKILLLRLLF